MQGHNRNEQMEKMNNTSESAQESNAPSPSLQARPRSANVGRIALIMALILLVAAAASIGAAVLIKNTNTTTGNSGTHPNPGNAALAVNASGIVAFTDQSGTSSHSNVITLAVNSLLAPPAGFQYEAWLVDSASKHAIALGKLVAKNQSFTLSYISNGINLIGAGDTIEITLEHGAVSLPTGKVLLSAAFPPQAFVYVRNLLVSFVTTTGRTGLLVGLLAESQTLNAVAQLLQNKTMQSNAAAVQCVAQNVLDIIEGKTGAHYKPLSAKCDALQISSIGDGFGLLGPNGYIANAASEVSLAGSRGDATIDIRVHERHVSIVLADMQGWLATVQQDALTLLNTPNNSAKAQEIVTLADPSLHGVDINGDGSIDYVPGEAVATIAYIHGQYMAGLILAPNS